MEPIILTKSQARKIILNAAGLAHQAQFGTGIEAVYKVIDHLGFVQLDKNYVVERAHHHVMAARIPDYQPQWLADQEINIELSNDVFILSPFDFDYQIECFVPAPKRKYGYFSLPILAGETFIARMDAKADRKQKVLIVHNLHFEPIDLDEVIIEKFIQTLTAYILFNQCQDISFRKSNNEAYLKIISNSFSG